jgi:beta-glucuronidase
LTQDITIAGGQGKVEFSAPLRLWSPEDPHLYECRISFGSDTVTDRIGFREIRREGTTLLLNGKPLYLRGVCVHEDDVRLGKVSTIEDVTRRYQDAKRLGCNALRLAHYPHHEHAAKLADEMGLMLWEEVPVYWAIQFDNEATYQDAHNQLEEMMTRDRNRASVIIWGVGNENADTDARYSFMRRLADHAKSFDPTRLVGAACLINREQFRIEDRLADHLDIIGLNEYFGWYEEGFEGLRQLLANSKPDRPVLISEVGADALAGHHGPDSELFTEERQAWVFENQIEAIRNIDWICGFFPWLLYDFRSPRRQTSIQNGINRKGLIAEDKRTQKLAFEVIAGFYRQIGNEP